MDRMLCTKCAAASYSAAAKTLVEGGHVCPACGGPLALAPAEPVGAGSGAESGHAAAGARRFKRQS
jgi:hypothetical protein